MCGIVGGIAERNVSAILVEGLKRLEYRGYDSAGIALLNDEHIVRERTVGKVAVLDEAVKQHGLKGTLGIAHTRWATHGVPSVENAHPHVSDRIAVVHNGIIENYQELKEELQAQGFVFTSQTDTEVVAHLVARAYRNKQECPTLLAAVTHIIPLLRGAYALGIICADNSDELVAVRAGSPLVVGIGIGEHFIASDQLALLPVTNRFVYLEEHDVVRLTREKIEIFQAGQLVHRDSVELDATEAATDKGQFKHFMLKEIYEQPEAIGRMVNAALDGLQLRSDFLFAGNALLAKIKQVQILACGTSYHAGLVAKYWFEQLLRMPCSVEIASEFRYRNPVVIENTLIVCVSQSGETADTLAALRDIKASRKQENHIVSLGICNVPTSTLVRESDLTLLTLAGPEIGVASTKAFTAQLVALMLLVLKVGNVQKTMPSTVLAHICQQLQHLPAVVYESIQQNDIISLLAQFFVEKNHALFLGRGTNFPIALEGALKLKEISYIHAEGYAAGELKHGPLALVDKDMPVVILAPDDHLTDKLKSNMQEVRARGGELFVFTSHDTGIEANDKQHVVTLPRVDALLSPIVYSIPMQLLSYYVAVLRGTDVDQPRNLAKSVTVE